jgi:2-C-methyl-D-erythritol 4-phosphate cytidylyltransferase
LGAGVPKALVELVGRPMVAWSFAALAAADSIKGVVVAAPAGHEDELRSAAQAAAPALPVIVVTGGDSRSESVARALEQAGEAVVAVHDAARPLVQPELVERCIERLVHWGCDGVVAAARAVDAVKEADAGGRVLATLERANLWAVQTPQVFQAGALRRALAGPGMDRAYDDAQLVESAGGDVRIVEAPRHNLKVTTHTDLRIAELLLSGRGARQPAC